MSLSLLTLSTRAARPRGPPETLQAKAGCLVTEPQGGFAGSSGQVLLAYLKAQYLVAASGDKGKEGQCGARGQRGAAFLKQSFTF